MSSSTKILSFAAISAILVSACTVADINPLGFGSSANNAQDAGAAAPSNNNQCVPGAPTGPTPDDPNKYPKCACASGGSARCVPSDKIPAAELSQLDTCATGACVPDKLVASGGAAPTSCQSPFGQGACLNLCLPQVAQYGTALDRGQGNVCDEDERCAPCLNPLKNNAPTGACDIGKFPAAQDCSTADAGPASPPATTTTSNPTLSCPYNGPPIVDTSKFPSCGDGLVCVPTNLVPASEASQLSTCPTGLCAPAKSVAAGGQYLPKTCSSIEGAEGRCLNAGLPSIAAQKTMLTQDSCDANELCAPCYSPIDGKPTGACSSVSCDAPKQAAKTFTACCTDQGTSRAKCVPTSIIPAAEQTNLDDDNGTCTKGQELCVPNEMLVPNFKGVACTGSTLLTGKYTGVCLSSCLHFTFIQNLGISQGSCSTGFKCAPCTANGKPTNAPGCPGT